MCSCRRLVQFVFVLLIAATHKAQASQTQAQVSQTFLYPIKEPHKSELERYAEKIAKALDISHRTVEEYITNIRIKVGVNSKAELIEMAIDYFMGWP